MPQYVLRNIPVDIWSAFTSRANQEQWPLRALFFQLMTDYASGHISPSSNAPARLQSFAWVRPFYRRLIRHVADRPVDQQWEALVAEVDALRPTFTSVLRNVVSEQRGQILKWLGDTSNDPKPGPNKLSLRAISHTGEGSNRGAIEYEVLGLPPAQEAWIMNLPGQGWMFLRSIGGHRDKAWRGHYVSAKEALKHLEIELYLTEDIRGDTEHS